MKGESTRKSLLNMFYFSYIQQTDLRRTSFYAVNSCRNVVPVIYFAFPSRKCIDCIIKPVLLSENVFAFCLGNSGKILIIQTRARHYNFTSYLYWYIFYYFMSKIGTVYPKRTHCITIAQLGIPLHGKYLIRWLKSLTTQYQVG